MAQRIIVQDGKVLYAASDPLDDLEFSVNGLINVTKQVNVGDDPMAAGLIQTPTNSGADLIFRTNTDGITDGNIKFEPTVDGNIILNNVVWPDGTVAPVPGMYLGVSSINTLQFLTLPASGGGSAPLNEIVYGTGPSVTSSPDFLFDDTTDTLSIGSSGPGQFASFPGQSLGVVSDTSISLNIDTTIAVEIDSAANVAVGGLVANSATDGFIYLPTVAGTPTGVPTAKAGNVPMLVDTAGTGTLWFYIAGTWRSVTLT